MTVEYKITTQEADSTSEARENYLNKVIAYFKYIFLKRYMFIRQLYCTIVA